LSKQEGGFGVKDLHRQNRCLLLNFIHQLHSPDPLPWKIWVFSHTDLDLGELSSSPSFLERIVAECLPLYRAVTKVTVVSGCTTSFWHDRWLPGGRSRRGSLRCTPTVRAPRRPWRRSPPSASTCSPG
jgi:hypothetical protein